MFQLPQASLDITGSISYIGRRDASRIGLVDKLQVVGFCNCRLRDTCADYPSGRVSAEQIRSISSLWPGNPSQSPKHRPSPCFTASFRRSLTATIRIRRVRGSTAPHLLCLPRTTIESSASRFLGCTPESLLSCVCPRYPILNEGCGLHCMSPQVCICELLPIVGEGSWMLDHVCNVCIRADTDGDQLIITITGVSMACAVLTCISRV